MSFSDLILFGKVFDESLSFIVDSTDFHVLSSDSMIIVKLVASFELCFFLTTVSRKLSLTSSSEKSKGVGEIFQTAFVLSLDAFVFEDSDLLNGLFEWAHEKRDC